MDDAKLPTQCKKFTTQILFPTLFQYLVAISKKVDEVRDADIAIDNEELALCRSGWTRLLI